MKKICLVVCFSLLVIALKAKEFKGAEIYSKETWKYGKVDIRMRMATGGGILSTFFTYKDGSEKPGAFWEEIDIEVLGKGRAHVMQSNIISGNPRETSEELHRGDSSFAAGYHTYTLEWTPEYVAWSIDGVQVRKTEGEQVKQLTSAQSFRMNIWVAEWVDWVGEFLGGTIPQYQFVNWISYAKYTPGSGDNGSDFTADWRDDFDKFDDKRWAKADWTFDGNLVDFSPDNVVVKSGYLILGLTYETKTGFKGIVPVDMESLDEAK